MIIIYLFANRQWANVAVSIVYLNMKEEQKV